MEDVEYNDYNYFKQMLVRKYSKEESLERTEGKELYKLLFVGPKGSDMKEFVLDIIIQNKNAKVEFASILKEVQKFFPAALRDGVNEAKDWKDIHEIIERNKEFIGNNNEKVKKPNRNRNARNLKIKALRK